MIDFWGFENIPGICYKWNYIDKALNTFYTVQLYNKMSLGKIQ